MSIKQVLRIGMTISTADTGRATLDTIMAIIKLIILLTCSLAGVSSESSAKRFVSRTYQTPKYGDRILPPYQNIPSPNPTISPPTYTYTIPSPIPTINPPYTYSNPPGDTYIVPNPNPTFDLPLYAYPNPPTEQFIVPTPKSTINPPLYTYLDPPQETYLVPTPRTSTNVPTNMYLHPFTNPLTNQSTNTFVDPSNPLINPTYTYIEPPTNPSTNYLPPFINPPIGHFPTQAFQQPPGYGEDGDNYTPPNYQYRLMVQASDYGTQFGHQEARQGEVAQGKYYVLLPDGRTQVVSYVADQEGYRSKIDYQDGASV